MPHLHLDLLTIVTDVQALEHAHAVYAGLQNVSTLSAQRIAAQIEMESRRRLIAGEAQQQILQRLHWQLAAGYVQMLQAQRAGKELLERWRYLFALLRAERVVRDIQV